MTLAISGSRHYTNQLLFDSVVDKFISESPIKIMKISVGDAKGVDTLAVNYAQRRGIEYQIHKAEWDKYGKSAGPKRNLIIVSESQFLLALPSRTGKGTQNAIQLAIDLKKPYLALYTD